MGLGKIKRDYTVNYERYGECNKCGKVRDLHYSVISKGWYCLSCHPKYEHRNFIIHKRGIRKKIKHGN